MHHLKLTLAIGLATLINIGHAQTIYTGDRINNVPVISQLDVADLQAGEKYRFWFTGSTDGIGQTFYVPVIVAKGISEGPKLVLNSGNHGDEVSGVRTVQIIMDNLDPAQLKGSVVAVLGSNPNALTHITRVWTSYTGTADAVNFNRVFPGKENGSQQAQHAWLMWNKLFAGNVNYAIDYHTNSTGQSYPFFIYADYRNPKIREIAELFPADQIKKDPGEPGSFETAFVEAGIPAVTLEIGSARALDEEKINRAVEGTRNLMIHLKMIDGEIGHTAKTQGTYIGNKLSNIRAQTGGYTQVYVKVGDDVKKDQLIAVQLNSFGDIVKEYRAQADGKILSTATDVVREPNALLARILTQSTEASCKNGC